MLSAFFVNSLADTHDATPGDGIAADAEGFTTLRAALEEANALVGADTITLPTGTITLDRTNGPLPVADDITIRGTNGSQIDGTAFAEAFSIFGSGQLRLDQVDVSTSGPLAVNLRPTLLTTNARQADLIVAFSATPSAPLTVETKVLSAFPALSGSSAFEELPTLTRLTPITAAPNLTDSTLPTSDEAIEQIINALFQTEPDFVLPVSAEQTPRSLREVDLVPAPKVLPEERMTEDAPVPEGTDDSVSETLCRWKQDAGWDDFEFLTRAATPTAPLLPNSSRIAEFSATIASTLAATFWLPLERNARSLSKSIQRIRRWQTRKS